MKPILVLLFMCITSFAQGQKEFRIEHTFEGNFDVYEGNRLVESIEKNNSGGYDVYELNSAGNRQRAQSVEKGYGDEYIVYSYANGYKEKSSTVSGYDKYLRELYGISYSNPVRVYDVKSAYNTNTYKSPSKESYDNPVRVYPVDSSPGLNNLGRTVLPASVKPFDFSGIDRLMEIETRGTEELEKRLLRILEIAAIIKSGGISEAEKNKLIAEAEAIAARSKY